MMPTPYERLTVAWNAPDRRKSMNRTVEDMAAEGVSLADLDAAIEKLLLEIRAAGADEGTEEEIMGIGDRLHGWVVESNRIHTRPAGTPSHLPTRSENPIPTPAK
jgi:hypothetical protein